MIDEYSEDRAQLLLEAHPEFRNAGALVVQAIRYALPQISEEFYGDKADIAVELLACDWLATSPYGQNMRSDDDKDKPTRYRVQLDQIKMQISPRMLVL